MTLPAGYLPYSTVTLTLEHEFCESLRMDRNSCRQLTGVTDDFYDEIQTGRVSFSGGEVPVSFARSTRIPTS